MVRTFVEGQDSMLQSLDEMIERHSQEQVSKSRKVDEKASRPKEKISKKSGLTSSEGGKGKVVNLQGKQWRKSSMILKQRQILKKSDPQQMARQTPAATPHADLLERPLEALTRD